MKSMMEWAALVFWTNRKDYEHLSAAEQESITAEATKVQSGCSHFDKLRIFAPLGINALWDLGVVWILRGGVWRGFNIYDLLLNIWVVEVGEIIDN